MASGSRRAGVTHGSSDHLRRPPGGSHIEVAPPTARHCWVLLAGERQPGLLLDWRRDAEGHWEGLVVRQIPGGHAATWVRAVVLEAAADTRRR